ncbi:MAG: 3(2), 5-bisphosphate nucleotidase [Solirubrobacteraceae bacterium]|jgi:3'(2'), 5'-bisphosphate nucleotidase|nr:3(2), 5-bisphosphate nucleotidase [Solirubrobacteraceae bacterium]
MTHDAALARAAANAGGLALTGLRTTASSEELGRLGDALSHQTILGVLGDARPEDAVLSEEAADNCARLSATRVWIVDPLDGTREYTEAGRTDWAVHVALWSNGDLVAGAVALPGLGVTLATDEPPAVPLAHARPLRIAVSRTRPPSFIQALARDLGAELVPLGSAGYKIAAVIRGDVDAYVHGGGQYEWDSAAPVAVAWSAGLHASRLDGAPLAYNSPDPFLPDLLVCRPELAAALLDGTATAMAG